MSDLQLEWLDKKVRQNDFASRAHGIRYCIQHVLDESEGRERLIDIKE